MKRSFYVIALLFAFIFQPAASGKNTVRIDRVANEVDLVVYGGTSAALTAAIQAKKMGRSVVVVSPDRHLGGLTVSGLGSSDIGHAHAIGGLSYEFYRRLYEAYMDENAWPWDPAGRENLEKSGRKVVFHFEPSMAEKTFENWIAETGVPVVRGARLDREQGVKKEGKRIVSITTLDGETFHGKMFLDATYEGDLMAAAGVEYVIGRESNDVYGEKWNGNRYGNPRHAYHQFKHNAVDPYVEPGNPDSGLLKFIESGEPGGPGEGDKRIQAYCFRMCMTSHAPNRVPFPKPEGYDPADYELFLRVLDSGERYYLLIGDIPNFKTDSNNGGPFSTDFIGGNYDYPEASYEEREKIVENHKKYQQGYMYFLVNDPRVPEDVRKVTCRWGLAKDEFVDNDHWPYQLYIREARRMVGEYVMTEHECLLKRQAPRSVGMGSYTLDSHHVRRFVTPEGFVVNEGDIEVPVLTPYDIDLGAVLPKRDDCVNLVVPVCLSASHISFGSIRMEPVFMILGQSAATAAIHAIEENVDIQEIDYPKLRDRLLSDGQRLGESMVLDNEHSAVRLEGNWRTASVSQPFVGETYLHDGGENKGNSIATYPFEIIRPGTYEIRLSYPPGPNRAGAVPVTVRHRNGTTTVRVDQKTPPPINGLFTSVGRFEFDGKAEIVVSNEETDGHVIVDAVQVVLVK